MNIYVASSWRNPNQPEVVASLRAAGFDVYDFKNPAPGDHGFGWRQTGHDPASGVDAAKMRAMLESPAAVRGFGFDSQACAAADACVLALPCGRSAHLEAGWIAGRGRPVVVYAPRIDEPELMYKFFDVAGKTPIFQTLDAVVSHLRCDAVPFKELLAKSSLGTVPMPQHTKLMSAVGELVETISGVLDEVGAHMTRERRRELHLALEVVKQAAAGG